MDPIYLDYNASTPLTASVKAALREAVDAGWGNPSSGHVYGRRGKDAVETARARVATALGAEASEIVFTSGGSEANNHAIQGVAFAPGERGRHLVISAVEHPAVTQVARWLMGFGFETTAVGVDRRARVDPGAVAAAIRDDTVLVSVMHAQNEVGTIQPVAEIATIARERGVLVHTDAAQSLGKIPVDVNDLGVDLLSVAGHKFHAPKGVGALYVRSGTPLARFVHGAGQEAGRRAGTENALLVHALGVAMEEAARDLAERSAHMRRLRDRLYDRLIARVPDLHRHVGPEGCLPNTLSVAFPGREANALLAAAPGVAASAGSACHTGSTEVSGVLGAMGAPAELARGTVRLSTGILLTEGEVDRAAEEIAGSATRG